MTTITRLLPLAILSLVSNFLIGQTRIYVNVAAIGPGDGSSWANAYVDLQEALIAAQYGNEIWVAHGTYYPTLTIDRDIYFSLKNGVKLYGGFAGVESQLSERDWTVNETVLSGDIGVLGDSTDNTYNILFIGKSDTTTIVDGFVFLDGNADGPPNGSTPNQRQGAAIQIFADQFIAAYPKIHNCKFEHNSASAGGAVAIMGDNIYGSAGPHFQNCLFRYNSAETQGGAIFRNGHSSLEIKDDFLNCTFENNRGDAIYYGSYNPKNDIFEVVGCNFISNIGGGIRISEQSGNINEGKIEIRDCNFTGNQRTMGAGLSISAHPSSVSIINSTFIGNSNPSTSNGNGSTIVISYNSSFPVGIDSFELDVSQCIFKDNSSNYHQPIISLYGNGSDADVFTKLSFRDNLFEKNSDGIHLREFNSSHIYNCIFEGNGTQEDRHILNAYLMDKTVVTNSIFTNNKGILFGENSADAMDTISNCTFYHNLSLVDTASSQLDGSALITNCIFHQEIEGTSFPFEAANVTLENSLILSPDCSALPAFVICGPGNIFGLEPVFADTAAGDFHLLPTSPGTGAGDNDIVIELGILTDFDGNPRIQGGTVDMGAYESDSDSNNSGVKYVNTNVQGGNNDGTSWANAYLDLQDALAASQYGDEIWVAKGTYYPTTTTDRNISFELKNGVKLYGGFVGTETQLSQRDWVAHETVLSGDIGVLGDSLDNSYNVVYGIDLDSTTMVNGFHVVKGNADNQVTSEPTFSRKKCGGGFHLLSGTVPLELQIINCSFSANTASYGGGGIFLKANTNKSLNPVIKDCIFLQNRSLVNGGGIYYTGGVNQSDIVNGIVDCSFIKNDAYLGGSIFIYDGFGKFQFKITSSIFTENASHIGAIYHRSFNDSSEGILISDCSFNGNTASFSSCFHAANSVFKTKKIKFINSSFYGNINGSLGFDLNALEDEGIEIDSCIFENSSQNILNIFALDGSAIIKNSVFKSNQNITDGIVLSSSYSLLLKVSNCLFKNNEIIGYASCVDGRHAIIANSIFSNNQYSNFGHAVFSTENLQVLNSTFYEASNIGNTNYMFNIANAQFTNVIIQKQGLNSSNFIDLQISQVPNPVVNFSHSLISIPDCNSLPITCGPGMIYNLDPKFVDPDNGDFHLLPTSPAINAGDNAIVNSLGILTDFDGNPRIQGGTVDMGAYESDSGSNNSPGVKYVNVNVQGGNNDGTSWANAYLDLQDALAASQYGDEIWVAKGTYYPTTTTDRNISFELKNGVKLYGGFAGTETQLGQRDWVANETVLSGDIGVLGDAFDNVYTVVYMADVDSSTVFDGFKIMDGNANANSANEPVTARSKSGGGVYITSNVLGFITAPRVKNCAFIANNAVWNGGALYIFNKQNFIVNPFFEACTFSANSSKLGGAVNIYGGNDGDDLIFLGCDFNSNFGYNGGAMHYYNLYGTHQLVLDSCLFDVNFADDSGGAYFQEVTNPVTTSLLINNCKFSYNSALSGGAVASISFVDGSHVIIQNSRFSDNFGFEAASIQGLHDKFNIISSEFTGEIGYACMVIQESPVNIYNCVFNKCVVNDDDGNLLIIASGVSLDTFRITNSTFYENDVALGVLSISDDISYSITNSLFKGNTLNLYGKVFQSGGPNPFYANIYNCLFDVPDDSYLIVSPITVGPGNLFNLDPLFLDPDNGDFRLSPCSPARNAGSNAIVDSLGILTDIEGSPRIQGGTVDMGAYESPAFQAASAIATSPACPTGASGNGGTGTAAITLENGCPPFFLDWGTGNTVSDTSNFSIALPVGTHSITVTDGRMESDTVSVTITSSPAITANAVAFPVNCANSTGGTASVEAIGGTGTFSFAWANPDGTNAGSTASINGLAEGNYTVTVTDALGCTAVDAVEVLPQGSLTLGINIQPVTCPGDSDGTATVQPIGGTMPFAWLWQGGQTTPTIDGLSGGSYAVTVTDALGCTGDLDFTINPPTAIDINFITVEPDCNGGLGSASATASGGSPGYEFDWDNGANTASVMLPAGPHTVTVTDAHGCTAIDTISLDEPPLLEANVTPQPAALCDGSSDGSIAVNAGGGTGPYTWGGTLANLAAGTYTVTVTDANGCTATATASIAALDEIAVMDTVTDASGPTALDGSIVLTNISGGTGSGYAFLWSNGSTAQNLMGVPTGDYTVTVTDSQGCTGEFNFFVDFGSAAGEQAKQLGAAIVPNPSGSAGAVLVIEKRSADMRFAVLDALGRVVVAEQKMAKERQPLPQGLAPGSYIVVLKNGEGTAVLKWIVTE